MNRTDRLLAILLELRSRKKVRAEDLAETFEVSRRSIYRDIQALCEAGVPVIAVPGQGYSLMEGYFLPPLSFSAEEATILLVGSDVVARSFDSGYAAAAGSAKRKIEAVLPERMLSDVDDLRRSIRFVAMEGRGAPDDLAKLGTLRRAIVERRGIRFRYTKPAAGESAAEAAIREADPYGIVHVNDAWYLIAHCHLRNGIRNFRLSRIDALETTGATFRRPEDFALRYREDGTREYRARVLFDRDVEMLVQESGYFYIDRIEPGELGPVVALRSRSEADLLPWLLGWGTRVRVLEPASLRERLAREGEKISSHHRPG